MDISQQRLSKHFRLVAGFPDDVFVYNSPEIRKNGHFPKKIIQKNASRCNYSEIRKNVENGHFPTKDWAKECKSISLPKNLKLNSILIAVKDKGYTAVVANFRKSESKFHWNQQQAHISNMSLANLKKIIRHRIFLKI